MIITPGVCVQCLSAYTLEVKNTGSSSIEWAWDTVEEVGAHLEAMYNAGTPHRIVPTFLWEPDPEEGP